MDAGRLNVKILGLALLMICAPLGAQQTEVCPTLPGTNLRDYSKPCFKVEGKRGYQTIPGTSMQDYGKPGAVMQNDLACPTLPGTNMRDYSKACYKAEGSQIVPTLPGTSLRDYSRPGMTIKVEPPGQIPPALPFSQPAAPFCKSNFCIQGNVIYPVLPGTQTRDYTRSGALVVGSMLCPTLSGTDVRDYSRQCVPLQ